METNRFEIESQLQAQMAAAMSQLHMPPRPDKPRVLRDRTSNKRNLTGYSGRLDLNPDYDPKKSPRTHGRYLLLDYDIDLSDPAPDFSSIEDQAAEAAPTAAKYMRFCIQQFDFNPSLEICQLKLWDHVIRGFEQVIEKLGDDWRITRWKIKNHAKSYDGGTEFWNREDLRLRQLLNGLTVQGKALKPIIRQLIDERERAVAASGINFGAYKSLRVIAQDRRKARLDKKQMEQWANLSPRELYLRGRRLAGYDPRLDGIDAINTEDDVQQ